MIKETSHAPSKDVSPGQDNDPPLCARCHLEGYGCCALSAPASPEQMFGLTLGEIKAMAQASGLAPQRFVVADRAAPEFLAGLMRIHPVFGQIMPGCARYRLAVDQDGACCFLGAGGCRLAWEARPLYCRLYPFWFTPDGRLMVLLSDTCLAQKGAHSWREVLARLGEDEQRLRGLFDRLQVLAGEHLHRTRAGEKP